MNSQEKIQKIENYFNNIIPKETVISGIEMIQHSEEYKENPSRLHQFMASDEHHMVLNIFKHSEKHSGSRVKYINDISSVYAYPSFYVPSTNTKEYLQSNFRMLGKRCMYTPDQLSTETTLDELEELIFELHIMFGKIWDINKFLIVYVLYKNYTDIVPDHHEMSIMYGCPKSELYTIIGIE